VIFSFELTNDYHSILPLLIACMVAHAFTVLTLKRSILTEKLSRRGHHLTREYVVDPLEALAVQDVMTTNITVLPADATISELEQAMDHNETGRGQRLYPVIGEENRLMGVLTRGDLRKHLANFSEVRKDSARLADIVTPEPVVAYPDERLVTVAGRMAMSSLTRFPVVQPGPEKRLIGIIALQDLLKARELMFEEEQTRERVLRLRLPPSLRFRRAVVKEK
jgi:CBS domain-containing protein